MNIKSGKIETFDQYSQFKDIHEFNRHMELWYVEHKVDFTKAELVGLKRLVRFSAKVAGVCNAKIGTILKAIHEDYKSNGISRSTFKRMILKAKQLGIITTYETERKNGSQTSNLYIFNRFPSNEPPNSNQLDHPNKTNNLFETKNKKDINKRYEEPSKQPTEEASKQLSQTPTPRLDHTFTDDRIPKSFVGWVKIYFNDAKTIEEFWKMTKIAAYKNNLDVDSATVHEIAIASFKQLVRKTKTTKSLKNHFAYYYGILIMKFKELYFEDLYEMGFPTENTVENEFLYSFQQWLETS